MLVHLENVIEDPNVAVHYAKTDISSCQSERRSANKLISDIYVGSIQFLGMRTNFRKRKIGVDKDVQRAVVHTRGNM